jgi:hypothetical protein
MSTRLLALSLLISVAIIAFACSSDDTKHNQSVPPQSTQGVAPVGSVTSGPPMATPPPPSDSAPHALITPAPPPSSLPPAGASPPSASGSTVKVDLPFNDAPVARSSLLGTAQLGGKLEPLDGSDPIDLKSYPGWLSTYPTLRLIGPLMNATPNTVSVYRGPLKTSEPISANNHKIIAFSVLDTKGACAAGVIRGYPDYSEFKTVDIGSSPCNADSVLTVLRR